MAVNLNVSEEKQYQSLLECIRSDPPYTPKPARAHIALIRGRACVKLNQEIDAGIIKDIFVDRSGPVDQYYHH